MTDHLSDTMPERDVGDFLDFIDEAERLLKKHGYYDASTAMGEVYWFVDDQVGEIERLRARLVCVADAIKQNKSLDQLRKRLGLAMAMKKTERPVSADWRARLPQSRDCTGGDAA